MADPTTFHNFTLLPAELRNEIWALSLPPPRVFDIYPASPSQKTPAHLGLRFANLRSEPPPPLAAVCRESRSFALHHYRPLTLGGTTTKYVDLSRDVLLLESCLFERNLLRTLLFMGKIPLIRDGLRKLAFGTSYGVHTGVWHPVLGWTRPTKNKMGRFLQRLGVFTGLETLVFMVHQEVQYEVAELPYMRKVLEGTGSWDGQVSRNATVYEKGTPPPPGPRMLMGSTYSDDDMSSRASTPSTSSEASFGSEGGDMGAGNSYRLPWTDERPWLPHENEVFYYTHPSEGKGEDDVDVDDAEARRKGPPQCRGPTATNDDWLCFQRTLKRDLQAGVKLGLAESTARATGSPCKKRKRGQADNEVNSDEQRQSKCARVVKDGYKLPAIQGASLLWRYALPSRR